MRWLRNAYVLTAVAGLGFFLLSFLVLAVWPNQTLNKEIAETRPADVPSLAANELRGRAIYGREGCVNCHSQLIRTTEDDVRRFGVATQAWETADEFPQMWGTRRDRPGPGPRARPQVARLAPGPPLGPALGRARFEHAALSVAVRR